MDEPKVIALGQAGVDFVGREKNTALKDMITFEKAGGGTPANTAVGLAKLGVPVLFIGKVGDDSFGHFLADSLQKNGVDVSGMKYDKEVPTTIGFESTLQEPELLIYGAPGPHIRLTQNEIEESRFQKGIPLFLFGSMTLTNNPGRNTTFYAADLARKQGIPISFDPNLRLALWPDEKEAKNTVREALSKANIVKLSYDEYKLLAGNRDTEKIIDFREEYSIDLLFVTRKNGCFYSSQSCSGFVGGREVDAVDTTGAGDGFCAGFLYKLLSCKATDSLSLGNLDDRQLREIAVFANASGALTTLKRGVIPALPTLREIETVINNT